MATRLLSSPSISAPWPNDGIAAVGCGYGTGGGGFGAGGCKFGSETEDVKFIGVS